LNSLKKNTKKTKSGALKSKEIAKNAEHFVTTSVPTATSMRTAEDLEQAVNGINNKMKAPEVMDCNR
jgi:hypothetical protein